MFANSSDSRPISTGYSVNICAGAVPRFGNSNPAPSEASLPPPQPNLGCLQRPVPPGGTNTHTHRRESGGFDAVSSRTMVAQVLGVQAESRQHRAESDRTTSAESRPNFAACRRIWSTSGQSLPGFGPGIDHNSDDFEQRGPDLAWPMSTDLKLNSDCVGQIVGRVRQHLGCFGPSAAQFGPLGVEDPPVVGRGKRHICGRGDGHS